MNISAQCKPQCMTEEEVMLHRANQNPDLQLQRVLSCLFSLLIFTMLSAEAARAQPPTRVPGLPGTTIVVNSAADGFIISWPGSPPVCTLRDAIVAANTNQPVGGCPAGRQPRYVSSSPFRIDFVDQIVFNIGQGTPSIRLRWALPEITEPVTIDGATGGATRVEINGGSILVTSLGPRPNGLVVTGRDCTLKNLVINRFAGHGIVLTGPDGKGIPVVTPPRPDRGLPTGQIGPCGPYGYPADPSQCPPPGGDGQDGVTYLGTTGGGGNVVSGCLVGTDATGTVALGNGSNTEDYAGIAVLSSGNLIGGPKAADRNVISGNRGNGLIMSGRNNHVLNNAIGTDASGTLQLGNNFDGVNVRGGEFSQATGTIGSWLGAPATGGNVIAYNLRNGIDSGPNYFVFLSNSIHSNGWLGIDVDDPGVTPNAANRDRNFPVLFSAVRQIDFVTGQLSTLISGSIGNQQNRNVVIQLFLNDTCDPSGHGEGRTYLGQVSTQNGNFSLRVAGWISGQVTATSTTTGTHTFTSEFSACMTAPGYVITPPFGR